jgi:hypothetical protein
MVGGRRLLFYSSAFDLLPLRFLKIVDATPDKGERNAVAEDTRATTFAIVDVVVRALSTTSFTPSTVSIDLTKSRLRSIVITTTHTLEIIKNISDIYESIQQL